ncbi:unnamed protein product [Mytilus edulis]|uniref:SRCR domain-containing protein n=1 Tax=Mytilus edulis TaxID=6550 RepID=A0A8S3SZ02_MYTED|nr:unnamed protein product [Mytilus edulis]
MVNFKIYNALLFVLELTVLFFSVETESVILTLCENSKPEYKNITCQDDEVIHLKEITYGNFPCQDESNSDCQSNAEDYFEEHCVDYNNCTLPISILYNNTCQRPPRRLEVDFECVIPIWFDKSRTRYICADSLAEINCPLWYHIHIDEVNSYNDNNECDKFDTTTSKAHLRRLCDDKRRCSSDTNSYSSLFHERFVTFSYVCKGQNDSPVTDTIHQSTSSDHELDITTITAVNATTENDTLPVFSFDQDHRIEINHQSLNGTLYMCSLGWDSFDAEVLCKSLNKNWTGKATVVNNIQESNIAPYSLLCGGLETSLFECNYTKDEHGCNIGQVAGAICCEDTDKPGECVMNPSSNKVSSESSTIGVAVGIPVAIIAVVCIIVLVLFTRRRRNMRKNPDNKTDDNYFGHQNIALPQHTTSDGIMYTQAKNTNTQEIEGGHGYSHPSEDTQSPYALSEDGVYDKANENRHVVNDTAVYSRAVDTMYDSTDQHNRQERKEGTYDHVFGQKTEDHYDITTRT